ncbi:Tyrosinase [Purpureocillium takamizusanense]|uniref:Tyrosinase n=1 Tax=Purpureocillium takamizusanense TaxID=2060973 RepID=A0A9Q8Q7U5_9HYPO|nr:Tyrosinase [Purpureocillium takamizusanense]UNI14071.1 Tyrosinase [Purpureocillium takamizusanense]
MVDAGDDDAPAPTVAGATYDAAQQGVEAAPAQGRRHTQGASEQQQQQQQQQQGGGSRRQSAAAAAASDSNTRSREEERVEERVDEGHNQEQQQQQQNQGPDSPPLPARHAAAAPGPRASRLHDIYAQALGHTLRRLAAWDSFAGCYPTVAARAEPILRQVQGQMVDKMREKCEKEFENILAARHVVPSLNELESLIADASSRRADAASTSGDDTPKPTPPHLLPPEAILSAHLAPALAPHQSLLNARLQTSQGRNALLADEVRRQRADVEALLARLEAAVDDVRGANAALGAVAEDLAAESRLANV